MKIKDIKNSLKNEQKQMGVPDVLARAKKAPINKLLEGQTPLRAFDKSFALRLLWSALALLVTIVLCFAVFMLMPSGTTKTTYGYIGITVEGGERIDRYGVVVDENSKVLVAVHESGEEHGLPSVINTSNESLESALKELYTANSADKVLVCACCTLNEDAQNLLDDVNNIFNDLLESAADEVTFEASLASDEDMSKLLEIVGGSATTDMSADEILKAYLDRFLSK